MKSTVEKLKNTLAKKIRQINYLVISLVKRYFHEFFFFWKKSGSKSM